MASLPATAASKKEDSPTECRRRGHRNAMRRLEKRLLNLQKIRIEPNDCAKLKISVDESPSLDLNSPAEPCFFTPYPDNLPSPDDDLIGREYPRILERMHAGYSPPSQRAMEVFRISTRNIETSWELHRITKKADCPHLQCMMHINVDEGDERLLRAEVLNIVRIMLWYLKFGDLGEHVNIPILMLSVMGPQHGRFLQAYFRERTFVINRSKLYNFKEKDLVARELFARWALAIPTGKTKLDETQDDPKDEEDTGRKGAEELESIDMRESIGMEESIDRGDGKGIREYQEWFWVPAFNEDDKTSLFKDTDMNAPMELITLKVL
ncbi:hypothetical protein F5884DRAFT_757243 [Xylogone sp. PMI_703]|nr:hypothetical protein F5884DRAFT_757243 [Xylogone sp. PMI_703]